MQQDRMNEHLAELLRAHLAREGIALARKPTPLEPPIELDGLAETEALLEVANLLLDAREADAWRAAVGVPIQRTPTCELSPELLATLRAISRA